LQKKATILGSKFPIISPYFLSLWVMDYGQWEWTMNHNVKQNSLTYTLLPLTPYLFYLLNRSTNGSDNLCIPEMEHIDSYLWARRRTKSTSFAGR